MGIVDLENDVLVYPDGFRDRITLFIMFWWCPGFFHWHNDGFGRWCIRIKKTNAPDASPGQD